MFLFTAALGATPADIPRAVAHIDRTVAWLHNAVPSSGWLRELAGSMAADNPADMIGTAVDIGSADKTVGHSALAADTTGFVPNLLCLNSSQKTRWLSQ